MGCQCSAPIDKKQYLASQQRTFKRITHQERVESVNSRKHVSHQSTDDDETITCINTKNKKRKAQTCKSTESDETRKQFELSHQRLKQKSRRRTQSFQQLQNSGDIEESVVVSIFDRRDRDEVETIMDNLDNLGF